MNTHTHTYPFDSIEDCLRRDNRPRVKQSWIEKILAILTFRNILIMIVLVTAFNYAVLPSLINQPAQAATIAPMPITERVAYMKATPQQIIVQTNEFCAMARSDHKVTGEKMSADLVKLCK